MGHLEADDTQLACTAMPPVAVQEWHDSGSWPVTRLRENFRQKGDEEL
jgi:hypothetical protein